VSSSTTERDGTTTVDVTMPQMGVSVTEGTVTAWSVAVGEVVSADQPLCEIETDKITSDIPCPAAGVLAEILVDVGSTVEVGTVLARVAVASASGQAGLRAGPGSTPPTRAHPGLPTGARASSSPPARSASAADAGAPEQPRPNPSPRSSAAGGEGSPAPSPSMPSAPQRHYSPVVTRIAAAHDVDLASVVGTGRGGRVRKQDVLALVEAQPAAAAPLHIESPYVAEPAATAPAGELSRMRRSIGAHMKRSLETAATCTTWIEADMARVEAARARAKAAGSALTALPIVARCVCDALAEHPALNATLEGERYARHDAVHLGIAVSLGEEGLIVPVIRDAQELTAEQLSVAIKELARRARAGQLSPDEVRGGTFTITNPGQFGSLMATPVINQPQVAILDLEAVVKRPIVLSDDDGNDMIAIRPQTILGLSWDHRALDGAQAAQFLAALRARLEGWDG
jgi:pyruvate/2-oxoglutarate dehydrogenase complex dihydrolipoamide acyltransferase (E2) component